MVPDILLERVLNGPQAKKLWSIQPPAFFRLPLFLFFLLCQIVQYISLVGPTDPDDLYYTTVGGDQTPWYDAEGFQTETEGGHGSHTAGTAAGSTINTPAQPNACLDDELLSCFGECLNASDVNEKLDDTTTVDLNLFCEEYNCDGWGDQYTSCIAEDTETLLTANGGVAQGAKLAIFDVSADGESIWAPLARNELWEAAEDTGCMVHSNSWGGDTDCAVDSTAETFDQYMYEVRKERTMPKSLRSS